MAFTFIPIDYPIIDWIVGKTLQVGQGHGGKDISSSSDIAQPKCVDHGVHIPVYHQ